MKLNKYAKKIEHLAEKIEKENNDKKQLWEYEEKDLKELKNEIKEIEKLEEEKEEILKEKKEALRKIEDKFEKKIEDIIVFLKWYKEKFDYEKLQKIKKEIPAFNQNKFETAGLKRAVTQLQKLSEDEKKLLKKL